jgi:hypothetical protein
VRKPKNGRKKKPHVEKKRRNSGPERKNGTTRGGERKPKNRRKKKTPGEKKTDAPEAGRKDRRENQGRGRDGSRICL